jgi:hypothetical protein
VHLMQHLYDTPALCFRHPLADAYR